MQRNSLRTLRRGCGEGQSNLGMSNISCADETPAYVAAQKIISQACPPPRMAPGDTSGDAVPHEPHEQERPRRTPAKNARNDAEAIATAARQGNMRFVPIKSVEQQTRLVWHRVREAYKTEALAISNRLRGLLAEFGIVIANSDVALRRALADLDQDSELPAEVQELLRDLRAHRNQVRDRIAACDARIEAHAKADERCVRARAIIGIGPITADAVVSSIGSAKEFRNG